MGNEKQRPPVQPPKPDIERPRPVRNDPPTPLIKDPVIPPPPPPPPSEKQ